MSAAGQRLGAPLALAATLWAVAAPAGAQLGTIRFDNWLYYQQNLSDTSRWQYRPRVFVPFALRDGWTFIQRFDLPFYYTDASGPANPDGERKFHVSDALVEEIFDTPEVARNLRLRASLRLVMPTGGEAPFGADQWQIAPGFGFHWRLPDAWRGVTISPYVRYFHGFDAGSPGVTTKRSWDFIPTVTFDLAEKWSLSFYSEQPISYDTRKHDWFVPIEAMFTHRPDKTWEYSFGGAYAVVKDDPAYRWLIQGRLSYYF